ncbi:hypothetical protein IQ06DRAFT_298097 [Phaeosphaeriaceae sp. SRC1lsM3a]|nr:hypothetical protein IQ06DRAFT_298097 [Stagonospora sp. SRC1lsM3a]
MALLRLATLARTSLRNTRAHATSTASSSATNSRSVPQYEFLVIVRDLPTASRQNLPPATGQHVLSSQTFTGEILHSVNVLGEESNRLPAYSARGNVLACRAASVEEVEGQLRKHPYSKQDIWDMKSMTIWPLDTVHTSPFPAEVQQ